VTLLSHWVNSCQGASPEIADRLYRYGDGLFETLRFEAPHWLLSDYHLDRLERGCDVLEIDYPADAVTGQLELAVQWLAKQGLPRASGRLVVSRGVGGHGYGGQSAAPVVSLVLQELELPWGEVALPAKLVSCEINLASQPRLAGIKHANRLEQVLAAREVQRRGADEGVMLNAAGEAVCAVSANLFAVYDGVLLTPPILDCGVAGTLRRLVLEQLAQRAGIDARQASLSMSDLLQADELMLTNALTGIRSVSSLDDRNFSATTLADSLREHYFSHLVWLKP